MALALKRYQERTKTLAESLFDKKQNLDELTKIQAELKSAKRGGGGYGTSAGSYEKEINFQFKGRKSEWNAMDKEFDVADKNIETQFKKGFLDYTQYAYEKYSLARFILEDYQKRIEDPVFQAKLEIDKEKFTQENFNYKASLEKAMITHQEVQQSLTPLLEDIEGLQFDKEGKPDFDFLMTKDDGSPLIIPKGNYVMVFDITGTSQDPITKQEVPNYRMIVRSKEEYDRMEMEEGTKYQPFVSPSGEFNIMYPVEETKDDEGNVAGGELLILNAKGELIPYETEKLRIIKEKYIDQEGKEKETDRTIPDFDLEDLKKQFFYSSYIPTKNPITDPSQINDGLVKDENEKMYRLVDGKLQPITDMEDFTKNGYTEDMAQLVPEELLKRYEEEQPEEELSQTFQQTLQPSQYIPEPQPYTAPDETGGFTGFAQQQMQPQMPQPQQQYNILDELMKRYNIFGMYQPRQSSYGQSKGFNLGW